MTSRVAVRILTHPDGYLVKGRKTSQVCATFDEAWRVSVEYFACRRW
jgi:hypothetical protein